MAGRFEEARSLELMVAPVLEQARVMTLSWGSLSASARVKMLLGDIAGAERDLKTKWHVYPVEAGKTQSHAIEAALQLACLYCEQVAGATPKDVSLQSGAKTRTTATG